MLPDQRRLPRRGARARSHDGVAAALVSGFHHSHADHGEGFCTFNGLVVAADALRAGGRSRSRVAVLDMDLHYGNGTASLCADAPVALQLSIYGNDYHQNQPVQGRRAVRHDDGAEPPLDRAAERQRPGGDARGAGGRHWRDLLAWGRPDLLLYQAGADPYREDPYSPLALDHDDLRERDRRVFACAQRHGLPIAWVLAGGYTKDIARSCACT